jgi:hypothetical protein
MLFGTGTILPNSSIFRLCQAPGGALPTVRAPNRRAPTPRRRGNSGVRRSRPARSRSASRPARSRRPESARRSTPVNRSQSAVHQAPSPQPASRSSPAGQYAASRPARRRRAGFKQAASYVFRGCRLAWEKLTSCCSVAADSDPNDLEPPFAPAAVDPEPEFLPSTLEPQPENLPSTLEPHPEDFASALEPQSEAFPSTLEPQPENFASPLEPQSEVFPSTSEPQPENLPSHSDSESEVLPRPSASSDFPRQALEAAVLAAVAFVGAGFVFYLECLK